MSTATTPLSPRHERFVAEYLKDGNATQAYLRAGYAGRGAQQSASRLLRDPRIEAAIAAGRQHLAQALQASVERVTQEYAKIAFANVADFVSTDDDGTLRIDLEKAGQAQRAGILELSISGNHSKQQQTIRLKLGKLQALAALSKLLGAAAAAKPADRWDGLAESMHEARLRHLAEARAERAERALAEARAALAEARPETSGLENPNPSIFPLRREPEAAEATAPVAPPQEPQPSQSTAARAPHDVPPELSVMPPEKFIWRTHQHPGAIDSAEALKRMKPGGFPGWGGG